MKLQKANILLLSLSIIGFMAGDLPAQTRFPATGGVNLRYAADGPYVRYSDNTLIVSHIIGHGKDTLAQTYSVSNTDKFNTELDILPEGHPEWNFTVKLHELKNEPCTRPASDKLFVLSDIEGEFAAFRQLLVANKVIDEHYNWTYGKGQLIVCGDLFDRGQDVVPELWLLYKLEAEAREQGGYVHTILGNHDIMNLSGDFRYVTPKYFASAKAMGVNYSRLFDRDSELGRWLRTKNIIEKIGYRLYMHAGLSREVNSLQWPIEKINTAARPFYDAKRGAIPDSLKPFFGRNCPFWYRGYFMAPRATMATVDSSLHIYQCKQIVVGHTIVDRNIAMYMNGKVIGLDVDEHNGHHAAAIYENGTWYVADDQGNRTKLVYQEGNDIIKPEQIQ